MCEVKKIIDLGWANAWRTEEDVPDIVAKCNHPRTYKQIYSSTRQITCEKCGFTYKIDSTG